MKTKVCLIAALLLMLGGVASAEGATANASIVAPDRTQVVAPFSGTLLPFDWQAGDTVAPDDTLFAYDTIKVYATQTGTVSAVFAAPGDDAQGIVDRYGALCVIEPERPLYILATNAQAYKDKENENKYLHAGETLYLKSSNGNKGTGRVTAVNGTEYTVEILTGDYDPGDTIQCYRDSNHAYDSQTGNGKAERYADAAIIADGRIVRVHKEAGDAVTAGELLLEMIDRDSLSADSADAVLAGVDGVITAVQVLPGAQVYKGQYLCEIVGMTTLELSAEVDEVDIAALRVGDRLSFTMDAFAGETFEGTVTRIVPLGTKKQNATYYDVRLSIQSEGKGFLIGMNGTVMLP